MRDFDKVQEQEGFSLSLQQVYAALGAALVLMGLVFAGGYTLGKQSVVPAVAAEDPLVPADVQNESVAMLLARAAEEEADPAEQEKLELQFHSILPSRTGEDAEAPRPGEKPVAHTTASGDAKTDAKKEGGESTAAKSPSSGDAADAKADAAKADAAKADSAKASKPEAAGEKAVASKSTSSKESGSKDAASKDAASKDAASKDAGSKDSSTKTAKGTAGSGTEGTSKAGGTTDGAAKVAVKPGAAEPAKSEKTASKSSDKSAGQKGATDPGTSKNTGKGFTVQVSSYQEAGVADKLVRQLMAQGFTAYRVEAEVNGQKWYRVRIGSFESQEGAEKEVQRLKAARSELKPMIAHK